MDKIRRRRRRQIFAGTRMATRLTTCTSEGCQQLLENIHFILRPTVFGLSWVVWDSICSLTIAWAIEDWWLDLDWEEPTVNTLHPPPHILDCSVRDIVNSISIGSISSLYVSWKKSQQINNNNNLRKKMLKSNLPWISELGYPQAVALLFDILTSHVGFNKKLHRSWIVSMHNSSRKEATVN